MASLGSDRGVPWEYVEYQFCKMFHCLPQDLDDMPGDKFRLFCEFMRVEAKTGKLKASLASFYGQ